MNNGTLNRDRMREAHDDRFTRTNPRAGYAGNLDEEGRGQQGIRLTEAQVVTRRFQAIPQTSFVGRQEHRPIPEPRKRIKSVAEMMAEIEKAQKQG